jgi:hypothetical protein
MPARISAASHFPFTAFGSEPVRSDRDAAVVADAFAGALTRGSFKTIPACEETTNTQRFEEDSWLGDLDSNQD